VGTILKVKGSFKGMGYSLLVLLVSLIPKRLCQVVRIKMENIRKNLK
jgi:hypothetical protein